MSGANRVSLSESDTGKAPSLAVRNAPVGPRDARFVDAISSRPAYTVGAAICAAGSEPPPSAVIDKVRVPLYFSWLTRPPICNSHLSIGLTLTCAKAENRSDLTTAFRPA